MSDLTDGGFNATQYAFFDSNSGQWVFRGNTVSDIEGHLEELLEAIDETDGPGLLTTLKSLKEAGIMKEAAVATAKGAAASARPAADTGDIPAGIIAEATRIAGRQVDPTEIFRGIAKTGRNAGKPYYKFNDQFVNEPRRG